MYILRNEQKKLLDKIESGINYIIQAPVGSGKSILCKEIAKKHSSNYTRTIITTPTNSLLDQYANDEKIQIPILLSNVRLLNGYADKEDYVRKIYVESVDYQEIKHVLTTMLNFTSEEDIKTHGYKDWINTQRDKEDYLSAIREKGFYKEYHNIQDYIEEVLNTVDKIICVNHYNSIIKAPILLCTLTKSMMLDSYFTENSMILIDECQEVNNYIRLGLELEIKSHLRLSENVRKLTDDVIKNRDLSQNSLTLYKALKDDFNYFDKKLFEKIQTLIVNQDKLEITFEKYSIKFTEIDVDYLVKDLLNKHKNFILLSGTSYTLETQLDNITRLKMVNTFNITNNNVFFLKNGLNLSKKSIETTNVLYTVSDYILRIVDRNIGKNGIIHCSSKELQNRLYELLSSNNRVVKIDKEDLFDILNSSTDKVVLTYNNNTGFNGLGKLCEFQIIPKITLPMYKPNNNYSDYWYKNNTKLTNLVITSLEQTRGRGVRSKTDTCNLYILDNKINNYVKQWQKLYNNALFKSGVF